MLLALAATLLLAPAVSRAQEDEASLVAQGYQVSAASPEKGSLVWTDRADLESQALARWRGVPTGSGHVQLIHE